MVKTVLPLSLAALGLLLLIVGALLVRRGRAVTDEDEDDSFEFDRVREPQVQ
jgi:hypothetical protein